LKSPVFDRVIPGRTVCRSSKGPFTILRKELCSKKGARGKERKFDLRVYANGRILRLIRRTYLNGKEECGQERESLRKNERRSKEDRLGTVPRDSACCMHVAS